MLALILQRLTEPTIIDWSYKIYLLQHQDEIYQINNTLLAHSGAFSILNDNITDPQNELSILEKNKLRELRGKVGAYLITKTDSAIYYGLWGMLDVRIGLTYYHDLKMKEINSRIIKDHWFR